MYPLIRIGPLALHSYGLLLAAAILVGVFFGIARGIRLGVAAERMRDIALYGVLAGVLGGRLLGFLLAWDPQQQLMPQLMRSVRYTGAIQGGLVAAMVVSILYVRRHGLPLWTLTDAVAPGMALAQGIGRLGCFAAGCCYGLPTNAPWSVTFTHPLAASIAGTPLGIPLHPTQLYESVATLAIGLGLLVTENRGRYFPGRTFWSYALLYSVVRFVIEFYRAHPGMSEAAPLSAGQFISLGVGALSLFMLYRLSRRASLRKLEMRRA